MNKKVCIRFKKPNQPKLFAPKQKSLMVNSFMVNDENSLRRSLFLNRKKKEKLYLYVFELIFKTNTMEAS
jgi:hypothetical protein